MVRSTRPPEAALLRNARHAQDISAADAAAQAHITELEWARIEAGQGERAPADTIARMAHALGIRSDTLGPIREDAADELHALELQDVLVRELRLEPEDTPITPERARAILQDLQQRAADLDIRTAELDARSADLDIRMVELDARKAELEVEPKAEEASRAKR